jgi:[CysO sulfur-carrier protein]-S-L-cysteine hydrolase
VLRISRSAYAAMIGHAYDGLPDEACGLMGGQMAPGTVERFVPARNADASSRTYSIGPDGFAAADAALDPLGLEVVGVMHSHTHTEAYPSPTDVRMASEDVPYIIVSLAEEPASIRAFRIVKESWADAEGEIEEIPVVVEG